ncbi:Hsp20/alpha crystallin family protein [bacterium]|nr:Hsp20/alpha crystallin family protein [bacterium]
MERCFDALLDCPPVKRGIADGVWSPAVDVAESDDSFVVMAELPGMKKEDISIELENNVLSLKGERRFETKEEGENYHSIERSYGSFCRSFKLPKNVEGDAISAEYKDGVLKVTLPKKEEVKPKKVEIKV